MADYPAYGTPNWDDDLKAYIEGLPSTAGPFKTALLSAVDTHLATVEEGSDTLFGWSGATIAGIDPDFLATWMSRGSWDPDMYNANFLGSNNDFTPWIAANGSKACVVGIPLIPHDSGQDLNALLDQVIAGTRDDVFRGMGTNLAYWTNSKVYARLFWEMNIRNGSNAPGDVIDRAKFIAAWRHAVPLIRQGYYNHSEGQYGFTKPFPQTLYIDFSPLSDGADYKAFYPGDEFVDVVSMDVYACIYGSTTPSLGALMASVHGYLDDIAAFAEMHGKPVALGEWGNWHVVPDGTVDSHGRGDCVEYIDAVFDWAQEHNAAYLSYYNIGDNTGLTLADTPNSLARLKERVAAMKPAASGGSSAGVRLFKNNQGGATHGAVTDVAMNATDFNTGGGRFDLTTNPGKIKVTVTGEYIVGACTNLIGGDPGARGVQIKVNNVIVREMPGATLPTGGYDVRPGGTEFIHVIAGDVVSMSVYVAGNNDATINGTANPKDTALWLKSA